MCYIYTPQSTDTCCPNVFLEADNLLSSDVLLSFPLEHVKVILLLQPPAWVRPILIMRPGKTPQQGFVKILSKNHEITSLTSMTPKISKTLKIQQTSMASKIPKTPKIPCTIKTQRPQRPQFPVEHMKVILLRQPPAWVCSILIMRPGKTPQQGFVKIHPISNTCRCFFPHIKSETQKVKVRTDTTAYT